VVLAITTDLTRLTDAEALDPVGDGVWVSWGAGGTGAMILEADFYAQGSNCISRGAAAAAIKGCIWDNSVNGLLNFSANGAKKDMLIYIWVRHSSPGLIDTLANGGIRIILGSGITVPGDAAGVWSAWYVDGNNTLIGSDGWICYVIDPISTASTTFGGGVDLTAVRWYGAVAKWTAGAKGQTMGVDAIYYGRGELRVTGSVATAGAGFKEVCALEFGTILTRYGIITEKRGVYYVRGKIIIGDIAGAAATTFSSYDEKVVWETPHYYLGGNVLKAIPDASSGGTAGSDGKTTYNGLAFMGSAGGTTIAIGQISGTDRGVSGSYFTSYKNPNLTTPARTLTTVAVNNAAISLSIYGSTFSGLEGAIGLKGTNTSGDDCYSNTFYGCGRVQSNMEMRNCNILNSVADAADGAYIWESTSDLSGVLFASNNRAVVFEAGSQGTYDFLNIYFTGNTVDIRNEVAGGQTVTIHKRYDSNPITHEEPGGGTTTITTEAPMTVTCKNESGLAIEGIRVRVENAAGGALVSNGVTNSSGVYTDTYIGSVPLSVKVIARLKGYKFASALSSIIVNTGMSIPFTMIKDQAVNLP